MQNCRLLFKYKRKLRTFFGHDLLIRFKSTSSSNQLKLNVLFFGTDHFSLKSLILLDNSRKCISSNINRVDVITSFKAKGNPVKQYAEQNRIDCRDWRSLISDGAKIKYDLGVVVSFGHLIPESIINMFPLKLFTSAQSFNVALSGMINVHASLLPRWRGASPIIYAILNDDTTTGVSIMKIHPHKFDIGEILAQKEVPIPQNVLMPELHTTLANEGAELLVNCIAKAPDSLQSAEKQGDKNVSYAPRVPDSMAQIHWQSMTARYVCNLYRALYSFKWLTTHWHKRRVKIKEIDINNSIEIKPDKLPGFIEYDRINKCLRVYCSDGNAISVKRLSLEGKNSEMTAADFNNGFVKKVDQTQRFFT